MIAYPKKDDLNNSKIFKIKRLLGSYEMSLLP